jgi:hypothetical protein
MAKQIREFLTKLLREKYPDCQSIIKKLEEKAISADVWLHGEMSEKYTSMHRYILKKGEYIIPNDSYLSSGILLPLINYFLEQQSIKKAKDGKQYHFDVHTPEQILEEKHGKKCQKYRKDLDIAKQFLEKCKTSVLTISLTKNERSWLRHWLQYGRGLIDMWRNETIHSPTEFDEIREDSRYELYPINRCLVIYNAMTRTTSFSFFIV